MAKCSLNNPAKNVSHSKNKKYSSHFFQTKHISILFRWTGRMQLWQPWGKSFLWIWETFKVRGNSVYLGVFLGSLCNCVPLDVQKAVLWAVLMTKRKTFGNWAFSAIKLLRNWSSGHTKAKPHRKSFVEEAWVGNFLLIVLKNVEKFIIFKPFCAKTSR